MKVEGRAHTIEPSIKKRLPSVAAGKGPHFWLNWYERVLHFERLSTPTIASNVSRLINDPRGATTLTSTDRQRQIPAAAGSFALLRESPMGQQVALITLQEMQSGSLIPRKDSMLRTLLSLAHHGKLEAMKGAMLQMQNTCTRMLSHRSM